MGTAVAFSLLMQAQYSHEGFILHLALVYYQAAFILYGDSCERQSAAQGLLASLHTSGVRLQHSYVGRLVGCAAELIVTAWALAQTQLSHGGLQATCTLLTQYSFLCRMVAGSCAGRQQSMRSSFSSSPGTGRTGRPSRSAPPLCSIVLASEPLSGRLLLQSTVHLHAIAVVSKLTNQDMKTAHAVWCPLALLNASSYVLVSPALLNASFLCRWSSHTGVSKH